MQSIVRWTKSSYKQDVASISRDELLLIKAVLLVRVYTVGMNSYDATVDADGLPPAPTDPPFEVGDIFREYGPA